jgi:hypothetical protein
VADALDADPRLGPRERDLLNTMYRELIKQREQATREDAHPDADERASRTRNSPTNTSKRA